MVSSYQQNSLVLSATPLHVHDYKFQPCQFHRYFSLELINLFKNFTSGEFTLDKHIDVPKTKVQSCAQHSPYLI